MKRSLSIVLTFAIALLIVLALRAVVFSVLEIPHDGYSPVLQKGDRVLVQRWSYGYRLSWKGKYQRLCPQPVACGDWVAFILPDSFSEKNEISIGRIMACPGDTIWIGGDGMVAKSRHSSKECVWPVEVPASGKIIRSKEWDKQLYCQTQQRYEPPVAHSAGDSIYCFRNDYYWISSGNDENLFDSRTMGFLPEACILGKVSTILYSVEKPQRWPRLRKNRILLPVGK